MIEAGKTYRPKSCLDIDIVCISVLNVSSQSVKANLMIFNRYNNIIYELKYIAEVGLQALDNWEEVS